MTSTTIKIIAMVLMLFDHIAEFIPGSPIWFHWIGRISAPLFIFCMAWGFYYTHDRKKYLIRMYFFGLGMGIIDFICNNFYPNPEVYISNNIFVTLFLIGVIVWMIEYFKNNRKKGGLYLLLFVIYQIISTIICIVAGESSNFYGVMSFLGAIFGNLIFNEGSFIFVFLGVLIYFIRNNKLGLIVSYTVFSCLFMGLEWLLDPSAAGLLYVNYQWMMITALPLMLVYNGKKGKGLKYLFYLFYPLHIVILFFIGNLFF
jgi:hypothetical protein